MKTTTQIDLTAEETEVTIRARAVSSEVRRIQDALGQIAAGHNPWELIGMRGDRATGLQLGQVMRFHTAGKRVMAQTVDGDWNVRRRIRDLAEALDPHAFVQINRGEIIALRYVQQMDFSVAGTIGITLVDGTRSFVSRRSLRAFKQALGL
ncbi:LytTR family DNA-binding domain-containing protein [Neoactinobaculum massilliense]|uniref:LytTR family DNA-binding domain-containing protein n=1 Tax=Neoactinobaculum massilliense TaxID=2364794 RepID=UPI000F53D139|nr:LytTR family DNA-binding domain-containing protein [Neoactinobaculum massilliense]